MSFEEFVSNGECFVLDGEFVDNEYIKGMVGIEELNDNSFMVEDNGMFRVLSYA